MPLALPTMVIIFWLYSGTVVELRVIFMECVSLQNAIP